MKPELEAICIKWENENLPRNGAIRGAVDEAYQLGIDEEHKRAITLAVDEGNNAYQQGVKRGGKVTCELVKRLLGDLVHAPHKEGTCETCDSDFWKVIRGV